LFALSPLLVIFLPTQPGLIEEGNCNMLYAIYTSVVVVIVAISTFALLLNRLYIPVSTGRYDRQDTSPWQQYWGESYGPELKSQLLRPVFDKLETEKKLGDVIIDLGSGASPVTRLLKTRSGRKRICVDIAADNVQSSDELRVRLDLKEVGHCASMAFRKAMLRVCAFLGINPRMVEERERVDLIVMSDILNYVDFRAVLSAFANYLKPEGRIIVFNLPYRGNGLLFSDRGLKDNRQLFEFLKISHFDIEYKAFPKRSRNDKNESEELIVLVARKRREGLNAMRLHGNVLAAFPALQATKVDLIETKVVELIPAGLMIQSRKEA
jgi:SAM-dependent methyltransferase